MKTKLLIDSIMRQTTVLIAQLSATAGIRAPLAHIADEVFINLSKGLQEQGVPRKVVADMFGLALRSYTRRVRRLEQSQTDSGVTLWQAVLTYLEENGQVPRRGVLEKFGRDDPEAVGSVLNDLVQAGLISKTGGVHSVIYAVTPDEARHLLARQGKEETAAAMVWLDLCRNPGSSTADVAVRVNLDEAIVSESIEVLRNDGQLESDEDNVHRTRPMVIDVGSEVGWETAVFDHFQAVAAALTAKLRQGKTRSEAEDTIGGTTLSFEISQGHPLEREVIGLLSRMRELTDDLWEQVRVHNKEKPISEEEIQRVTFYFGQFVKGEGES